MTFNEQTELARRAQRGDVAARKKLAEVCVPMVIAYVNTMRYLPTAHRQDVIQEGHLGVQMAIDRYECGSPLKFIHFAKFWVKAHVLKYLKECHSVVRQSHKYGYSGQDFYLDEPIPFSGDSEDTFLDALADRESGSNDDILGTIQAVQLAEATLEKAATIVANSVLKRVGDHADILSVLLDVIRSRIYCEEPETLENVGLRHGISRERVRQLEAQLIKKARALVLFRETL